MNKSVICVCFININSMLKATMCMQLIFSDSLYANTSCNLQHTGYHVSVLKIKIDNTNRIPNKSKVLKQLIKAIDTT
jgi:hypothetical protein